MRECTVGTRVGATVGRGGAPERLAEGVPRELRRDDHALARRLQAHVPVQAPLGHAVGGTVERGGVDAFEAHVPVQAPLGHAVGGTVGRGGEGNRRVRVHQPLSLRRLRPLLRPARRRRPLRGGPVPARLWDAACPISTGGGTRRVRSVRGVGRGVSDQYGGRGGGGGTARLAQRHVRRAGRQVHRAGGPRGVARREPRRVRASANTACPISTG